MSMSKKIKRLLFEKEVSAAELARRLNTVPSNIYRKLDRDNFSEKELIEIAEILGCKYEGFFFLVNGEKI